MKNLKKIPKFNSEDEEREFWATHDSVDYIDWSKGRWMILPNLKPSLTTISLRMPNYLLDELKVLANKRDVPYQSLLKIFLDERVQQELNALVAREGKVDYSVARMPRRRKKPVKRLRKPA
ncbi:MAG: BrnA antitoxin family protein [Candidatus Krumholzibacteria bacterium]|nr:BrnA antitoxin family protein [Candidatus Krumholzibacteria bacterium]